MRAALDRLDASTRAILVLRAYAQLSYRVVAGPLSQQDMRELRLAIDRLDLPGQMQSMSRRLPDTSSL